MKQLLKKLAITFGILSVILPIVIVTLWYRYLREQESLYGNEVSAKKGCEPYEMLVSRESEKLVISWQTKEVCPGFLLLGTSFGDFSNLPYKVLSEQGESPTTIHNITVLKQDEIKYKYAIVVSDGEWFGIGGNPFKY
ncbi:hypothetical protein IT418_03810 [bacterium]|nr:hypothetical protein [bacterium]